jgi:hypothetical protein
MSNLVHTTRFCNNENKSIDIKISNVGHTTRFWKNLHQICSKYFESQIIFKISLEAKNPKEFKQISQIRQLSPMPLGEIR